MSKKQDPANTITQKQTMVAGFAALAICIHLFESSLPSVMGIKPGLANIITLIVLLRHGLSMALQVQLLRVFIASLLNGSIFSPTFFLSLSGSLFALLGLSIIYLLMKIISRENSANTQRSNNHWLPSPITFSVVAALSHMFGQYILAYLWLIPHAGLFKLLPVLLLLALVFGWVNGIMALKVLKQFANQEQTLKHA